MSLIEIVSIGNLIILFFTGVVVSLYTKVTFDLKKVSEEQKELSMLPLFAVYFRGKKGTKKKFRIRNIGNGVAFDINIDRTRWTITADKVIHLKLRLSGTNVLIPEEERDLENKVLVNGRENSDLSMVVHFDEDFANRDYKLVIKFKNILGIEYKSIIRAGKSGISILQPPIRN